MPLGYLQKEKGRLYPSFRSVLKRKKETRSLGLKKRKWDDHSGPPRSGGRKKRKNRRQIGPKGIGNRKKEEGRGGGHRR